MSFYQDIAGLTQGTTYYYCAITQNSVGTTYGSVASFTTPTPPTVQTLAATPITTVSTTLNGTTNPNGFATTGWFRYSITDPGSCNDTFGTRSPTSGGTSLGSGSTNVTFSQVIPGLAPATNYYFCAISSSSIGTTYGEILTFTTPASLPAVTTMAASDVTTTSGTLNATANPGGAATTAWFRYSTTNPGSCNDTFGTRTPASGGTNLGNGGVSVSFSAPLTGLTSGATYYFCAIASNAQGTSTGGLLTFRPSPAPSVTTSAATAIAGTSATLSASANPNGTTTTGWFRYSTTNPGTCDDTFGTRTPTSGGTNLGAGTTSMAYQASAVGLTQNTTYYYCAIASSTVATSFGAVLSFTTSSAPAVVTEGVTALSSSAATLNGTANPRGASATGWFRYSATNPGTCNDTFGARTPATGGTELGAGSTGVAYSQPLSGLTLGVTYYYCAVASNSIGTSFGAVSSFTTLAAPSVTTQAASALSSTGATLNATANPNLADATGWFRYSTSNPGTCNDTFGTPTSATPLGAGSSSVAYGQALSSLSPGTTYYYCAIASNTVGTSFGTVQTLTTQAPPSVVTQGASSVATTSATLDASANPNGLGSTGWFRYSTSNPGTCNDTFGTRAPTSGGTSLGSSSSATTYAQAISGLTSGATYYYCAIASSTAGTSFGSVLSFTTLELPVVATEPATAVSNTAATLGGSATPNGTSTTGWFRYSTANPGACNDTFGTRAPTSGGANLGSGSSSASYSQALTGLQPGTTYYYCAVASSLAGTSFGVVMSLTTTEPPTVTTTAASAVASTTATLGGSVNPNGADATGWFRYSTANPGACNDTFGTRTPASGGVSLGSGSSALPYSEALTALTPNTTYYYCAIASTSSGTGFGAVMSLTTTAAGGPSVTTGNATAVSTTDATLNASASPNGQAATAWFRYDTADPGACNDTFGVRAPTSGGASLGSGTSTVSYLQALSGLTPDTTYYFCAIVSTSNGTSYGAVASFQTAGGIGVTTAVATEMTDTVATLNGSADPNGSAGMAWFRYDTTDPGDCDDTFGTRAPASDGVDLGAGFGEVEFSEALTGLLPGATYYYCAIAENAVDTAYGEVLSFTLPVAPVATSLAATNVGALSATLQATASTGLADTLGGFRYDTVHPGSCSDTFGTFTPLSGGVVLGALPGSVPFSALVEGLSAETTYYYCATASNVVGTSYGAVLSFTTVAVPNAPVVATEEATEVASTSVTLNGTATANGGTTTAWFRYGTTEPDTCSDDFGTRVPEEDGTSIGAEESDIDFSEAVTELAAGTTYYFCAIAENEGGTVYGEVFSVTTAAEVTGPTVETLAAIDVTSDGAVLRGSANPNGESTTAWFRYDTTAPGECDDTFGTRVPETVSVAVGAGDETVPFEQILTDLSTDTIYYCAIAESSSGKAFGEILTFTPGAPPPSVTTEPAVEVDSDGARIGGTANPSGSSTAGWFRYGDQDPGVCSDAFGTRIPEADAIDLGEGTDEVEYDQVLGNLEPSVTYYYCAAASNAGGAVFGEVESFTTAAAPPVVTTGNPTIDEELAVTLNGTADPRGSRATGWFRYDTTEPETCDDDFGTRVPAEGGVDLGNGRAPASFTESLAGVAGGTIYVCAIASNEAGVAFGQVVTFDVPAADITAPADASDDGGCGCRVAPSPNGAVLPLGVAGLLLMVLWHRRRRA
jgi:hypothetical protein